MSNEENLARTAIKKGADQKRSELQALIKLLRDRKIGSVVEIGTHKGGTLYVWCRVAEPDATIVSIDLPGGAFGSGYSEKHIKKLLDYKLGQQNMFLIREDSHLARTKQSLMEALNGKQVDFLMIDGDHTYEGVKKDFEMYSPMVKKGGLIAIHDIAFHDKVPECKVNIFWDEIKGSYKSSELISNTENRHFGNWGGIGIIEV